MCNIEEKLGFMELVDLYLYTATYTMNESEAFFPNFTFS